MKLEYVKTAKDANTENNDLVNNQTVKFIKHQEHFKFNVGDILIMQRKGYGDTEWVSERTSHITDTPTKYMYVFENELGIGYIKQLKADGSGFTTLLTCVAEIDPNRQRLVLDPSFVDHLILSDKEDAFDYNLERRNKASFRRRAINKNKKLILDLSDTLFRVTWFHDLKKGDKIYMGYDWEDITAGPAEITRIEEVSKLTMNSYEKRRIENSPDWSFMPTYRTVYFKKPNSTYESQITVTEISSPYRWKVMQSKPWSLKDDIL